MNRPSDTDVTVIIPVFNDASRLAKCLAALETQRTRLTYEVLVVDNGSEDDPADVVGRFEHARLLREAKRGSYAARNKALSEAVGGIYAFTDSDCIPNPDWLETGVKLLQSETLPNFVGGDIVLFAEDSDNTTPIETWELQHGLPQRRYVETMGVAATANLFVRASDFRSVGLFNSEMQSSGDREWGQRAVKAGLKPVFSEEAYIQHPCRRTFGEHRKKARRIHRGDMQRRSQDGEKLIAASEIPQLLRPPTASIFRETRKIKEGGYRVKAKYVRAALFDAYVWRTEKVRAAIRQHRIGKAIDLRGDPAAQATSESASKL